MWTGKQITHKGKFYTLDARLYDPPAKPIPLPLAANGPKAMRLSGQHGDGLAATVALCVCELMTARSRFRCWLLRGGCVCGDAVAIELEVQ